MTNIEPTGKNFTVVVDNSKFYAENVREQAESNRALPGQSFILEVQLVPVTDYYHQPRTVLVRRGVRTLGYLPEPQATEWWPFLCAMHTAGESTSVMADVWTSEDWSTNFYSSIRLSLPTLVDAEIAIAEDHVQLDDAERNAWHGFSNDAGEYWDPRWVKAHKQPEQPIQQAPPVQQQQPFYQSQPAPPVYQQPVPQIQQHFHLAAPAPQPFHQPYQHQRPMYEINRPVMWLLWLFFGIIGGHRYYLGNIGMGLIQTFTMGGFGLWWIIDAFLINGRANRIESGYEPRTMF